MANKNTYNPDYAIHPGEILEETLQARAISKSELAARSGLTLKHISQIVHGKSPVTPETAVKLERILDVKASLWLRLDSDYCLFQQKKREESELEAKFAWAQRFPIKELLRRGLLPPTDSKHALVAALLDLFNVGTIDAWGRQYAGMLVQFRRAKVPGGGPKEGSIAAWLKVGENRAKEIATRPHTRGGFVAALQAIRPLTCESPEVFAPCMKQTCADAGVAVVFVREFPGTGISGATYWLGREKVILLLSLRYKSDDHLWFTFFHEAGHILLHGKNQLIVDGSSLSGDSQEDEANTFAANLLIPPKKYEEFVLANARPDETAIRQFARDVQIAPGIVVGRLQKDQRIPFSWHNGLKRRFELIE